PIAISTQPLNASRYVGDSVIFQVAAVKNGPMGYQWQFGGVDLPGKTGSVLLVSNLALTNAGNYSASVTNPYGSIHSADATLTMTDSKPIIATQPASVGAYPG